jgi:hypothetical protein
LSPQQQWGDRAGFKKNDRRISAQRPSKHANQRFFDTTKATIPPTSDNTFGKYKPAGA